MNYNICVLYKHNPRSGTYELFKRFANSEESVEGFNKKISTEDDMIESIKVITEDFGDFIYQMQDCNTDEVSLFEIHISADNNIIKHVKPGRLLSTMSNKDILIKLILSQVITSDFAKKCKASSETRGTNRFLKYKKLFSALSDDDIRWKNNIHDTTAIDTLKNYSEAALEELYLDLQNN